MIYLVANQPRCLQEWPAGLLQSRSEDFLVDSVNLKSEQGSKGGAYERDFERPHKSHSHCAPCQVYPEALQ